MGSSSVLCPPSLLHGSCSSRHRCPRLSRIRASSPAARAPPGWVLPEDDGSDEAVHGCSCGRSAWFWPSAAKVRTAQDRQYLENAIGDLKARMSLENINTVERQA
jgi:hypothetical protein